MVLRQPGTGSSAGLLASTVTHLLALGLLLLATRHLGYVLRPAHMPGTPHGERVMLTYRLGGPTATQPSQGLPAKTPPPPHPPKAARTLPSPLPTPARKAAPTSTAGPSTGGDSALGDEDLRIALPQVHPRPQPDLSTLPRGTAGDVIVDVLIDDAGKVTGTTLVKGLGQTVDTTVMEALRGWTFTPASRNGQNVASEQEILIHYERG